MKIAKKQIVPPPPAEYTITLDPVEAQYVLDIFGCLAVEGESSAEQKFISDVWRKLAHLMEKDMMCYDSYGTPFEAAMLVRKAGFQRR